MFLLRVYSCLFVSKITSCLFVSIFVSIFSYFLAFSCLFMSIRVYLLSIRVYFSCDFYGLLAHVFLWSQQSQAPIIVGLLRKRFPLFCESFNTQRYFDCWTPPLLLLDPSPLSFKGALLLPNAAPLAAMTFFFRLRAAIWRFWGLTSPFSAP